MARSATQKCIGKIFYKTAAHYEVLSRVFRANVLRAGKGGGWGAGCLQRRRDDPADVVIAVKQQVLLMSRYT